MTGANVLRFWAGKPLVNREMSKPILSTTKHYRVVVHTILPRWPTAKYVSVRTPEAILSGGTPEAILSGGLRPSIPVSQHVQRGGQTDKGLQAAQHIVPDTADQHCS